MIIFSGILYLISLTTCTPSKKQNLIRSARVIQTSKAGDRLTEMGTVSFSEMVNDSIPVISVNPEITYQEIIGFGGSFTESGAHVLNQLSSEKKTEIIHAYFNHSGSAYSLTRTHMNSCDFSLNTYSYAPVPGDTHLTHFSIEEDRDDLIPFIKEAMTADGADFRIIASPWTAPPWMKDPQIWNGGILKPEYFETWALFFSKYIKAYAEEGINIWGVTVVNEPLGNGGQWESMIFSPETMAEFVAYHLGPRFEKDNIDARILIYDQNRDHLPDWAHVVLGNPHAAPYVWGTAVHWYSSTVEWYPENLTAVHGSFPDKQLIHTEGCIDSEIPVWKDDLWYWSPEATDWGYDWAPDEDKHLHPKYVPVYRYARDIIGGLNSWLCGWIDWNMVLNRQGGPNHANNWCIAPVIADIENNEVYYTPLYYIMTHFSRFIRPGAVRIGLESSISDIMITACRNTDKSIVLEILNQSSSPVEYQIVINDRSANFSIPGSCLQTVILES
ncbi:MAG: glycosyl hydrolase family 30 [Calditrichaeota bacterium]|nr:glycoside hydrolase family 30 protein [Calditrichota bacterium]RQV98930.1 MAG: glycosyl hydrolase family 30 [Calditrichota bacterium]